MSPEEVTRTLAMFDAFLAFARAASEPAAHAHPPLTDVPTAVTAVRGPGAAEAPADSDGDVTRVTPFAGVAGVAPWEETTRERPDIMRALARSDAAQPDTDQSIALPRPPSADPRVEQASIIIEDDSLTEPEFRREDVLRAMAEHARPRAEEAPAPAVLATPSAPAERAVSLDEFAAEMLVLVKYGHAVQAAAEIDRWRDARPEDAPALEAMSASVSRAASRAARRE